MNTLKIWLSFALSHFIALVKTVIHSDEGKAFITGTVAAIFNLDETKVADAYDKLEDLAHQAEEKYPEPGQGAEKYAWVATQFGASLAPLAMDTLLHLILGQMKTRAAAKK